MVALALALDLLESRRVAASGSGRRRRAHPADDDLVRRTMFGCCLRSLTVRAAATSPTCRRSSPEPRRPHLAGLAAWRSSPGTEGGLEESGEQGRPELASG